MGDLLLEVRWKTFEGRTWGFVSTVNSGLCRWMHYPATISLHKNFNCTMLQIRLRKFQLAIARTMCSTTWTVSRPDSCRLTPLLFNCPQKMPKCCKLGKTCPLSLQVLCQDGAPRQWMCHFVATAAEHWSKATLRPMGNRVYSPQETSRTPGNGRCYTATLTVTFKSWTNHYQTVSVRLNTCWPSPVLGISVPPTIATLRLFGNPIRL